MVSRRSFMTGLGAGTAALATGTVEAAPPAELLNRVVADAIDD